MAIESRIERSLAGGRPWLFLSAHLDDAVLSCGALIEAQAQEREIIVATVFTEASPAPHTRAARSFLRQCMLEDGVQLFEARKAEDMAVLEAMGVRPVHLGAVDALFRRRVLPRLARGAGNKLLPELTHRYSTYRFDIALGRIARGDKTLIRQLQDDVAELMAATKPELLFCPVGVGSHVDHLITRKAGEGHSENLVLYSDFPYDLVSQPDAAELARLGYQPWIWEDGLSSKHTRIRQYSTQADGLFPSGEIPIKAETYFVPHPWLNS